MTLDAFRERIRNSLLESGFIQGELAAGALEDVMRIKREKYDTWDWNFGRSPAYDMINRKRFAGGTLEVRLSVGKGCITEIAFFGDYMSRISSEPLTTMLRGCPYRKTDVKACLGLVSITDMFGGISEEEVICTIFNE